MKAAAIAFAALAVAALATTAYFYSGAYGIGADEPHWPLTESVMKGIRNRSLDNAAAGVPVPKLDDPKAVASGARDYAEMCAGCHLSPLSRDSEARQGLYPMPPDFHRERVAPARAFWAIKHGIKMSGMPAWGKTHDDARIWGLVALLQKLPDMDAKTYQELALGSRSGLAGHGHPNDHHEHHH